MITNMTRKDESNESPANALCKACGLCCTGHLFIWAKLRPAELDPAEALGMHVYRSDPTQRGFSQPCPPHYPRSCRAYTCDVFDELVRENITMPEALAVIEQAKGMIRELEVLLPFSSNTNFRERLVARLEGLEAAGQDDLEFRLKAEALLVFYEKVFGVKDLLEKPDEA